MKISVIVTVLNEAEMIWFLLLGLVAQSHPPDEVIIVDANSTDKTVSLIRAFKKEYPQLSLRVVSKKGNRSQGRNYGISLAKNKWLAITDAGCIPHENWLAELVAKAQATKAEVIAGYYEAVFESDFQAAVVPYMLVMPDKINPDHFLPATRSMMLTKSSWKEVGGFDEELTLSEDYDFAHKLEKAGLRMTFTRKAVVSWWPIESLQDFYQTVKGMADHDARAGLTRIKAHLVICRYLIFFFLAFSFFCSHWFLCLAFVVFNLLAYSSWAIWKNVKYLDRGWYYLPVLQLAADFGVIAGTVRGSIKRLSG